MKKYLSNIILFSGICIVISFCLLIPQYIMANKFHWDIPKNKTTLFMGASHIVHGIDDKLLEDAVNVALESERYLFTYLKLLKLYQDNNNIHTIVLECGPTDLSIVADKKIFAVDNEMLNFVPMFYPYFRKEEWLAYSKYKFEIANILISRSLIYWAFTGNRYFSKYGGYRPLNNTFDGKLDGISKVDDMGYSNNVNLSYLDKIVDFCNMNDIKLTLIYCPVYKPELFYDQKYYYDVLKIRYSDVEYLDYSELDIPDNYRADPHHLNHNGAVYFTKVIADALDLKLSEK